MIRMRVGADSHHLEVLQYVLRKIGTQPDGLPKTANAMRASARLASNVWKSFAMGAPLPGVTEPLKGPNRGYAQSIKTQQTGPFDHEVYSESEIAARIENGTPELDMKTTHPYGPRSRVSEDGVPYLIVPIRWGTPKAVGFKNVMPINVYNVVKKFKKMRTIISADKAPFRAMNAQGKKVGRAMYNRGYSRLSGTDFEGTVEQKTRMSGMVRSTDSTGKNRAGGYFTFRVISARSPARSWIRPATPARNVTRAVAQETNEAINAMVGAAIMGDLSL